MNNLQPLVEEIVTLTLENVRREYPNYVGHVFSSADDTIGTPRQIHPAFYGCLDWHSAVHSHWQLVRVLRHFPEGNFVEAALAVLDEHLSAENLQIEHAYLLPRPGYERPYGLAWLLQLCADLRQWQTPAAQRWLHNLAELEALSAERIVTWLPKLSHPVRSGSHSQTAFSLGLVFDWAKIAKRDDVVEAIGIAANRFYGTDHSAPLAYEPSGTDFLSPALGEADLMRRVLSAEIFPQWLTQFLPIDQLNQLSAVTVSDSADGQLAHFAGLNLSRAWMLKRIAQALPAGDGRRGVLLNSAEIHQRSGMLEAANPAYMLSHWVPSFAIYLLTLD